MGRVSNRTQRLPQIPQRVSGPKPGERQAATVLVELQLAERNHLFRAAGRGAYSQPLLGPSQADRYTLRSCSLWKTDILPCRSQNLVSQGRSPFCASVLSSLNVPGTVYQALSPPHHFTQCTHYCTHPQLPVQHPSNHHSQTTHPPAGRSPHHQTIYIGSKI